MKSRSMRVLVAEDNFLLAMDMTLELRSSGAEVLGPFASLQDALAAAREEGPTCAVLDVDLLDGDVFPLADELRRRGVPFMFATGRDVAGLPCRFRAAPFLRKPINARGLFDELAALSAGAN